jgi:DNA topoisomerase-3
MGKALIIAEKPSVAADIAKSLGGFKRHEDYFESERFLLSSAVGHLLELAVPEEHDVQRGKWTFPQLPHLPPRFALAPIERNENRLKTLARLIKRKDVDSLINACDAGREGELIFRNIAAYTQARQPIQRLWLQSMTPEAIRDGFTRLRTDADMLPLADASICRAEADWLIGINGTRAMTAFNNKTGGFNKTTVGRVQTPTLAVVVEREQRIKAFVPRDYWEVHATFAAASGTYEGRWFDEGFVREKNGNGSERDDLKPERLWDVGRAEAIRNRCLHQPGTVTEESKPTSQLSPLLFDLTSLQREANSRFGFPAALTLKLAQALYEKHKALTYPRTDSRALPEDYINTVRDTLGALGQGSYATHARQILDAGWLRPNKRIFNNAKISDHFAIIPTTQIPKNLTEPEQKLYDLVTKRFLAVFFPAAEFLVTIRITRVVGEPFKTEGKVMLNPGWLVIYGREAQDPDSPSLPPVAAGETVATEDVRLEACQTKPPARFTEATLLSAMEGAGRLVEDDELREAMAEKGLGTPATRAQIIEGLIQESYLVRHGKELQPTAKAFSLMVLLNGLGVEALTKPELTGNWEYRLKLMERGRLKRAEFMSEIRSLAADIVAKAKAYEHDTIPGDFGILRTPCPKCGGEIHENYKKFQCQKCDFGLWKIISSRQFEPEEIETLITQRQVGPLQGFRSKLGKTFAAVIKLSPEYRLEFDFGNARPDSENGPASPVDFTGKEPLGACPVCKARVFENGMNFVCEKSVAAERSCQFRTGAVILQQPIDRTQIAKLLAEGKTDLLKGFVSKKTGRKFEAFLALKNGEVKFEFAPRPARPAAGEKKKAAPSAPIDFATLAPIGKCPVCGGRVFETPEQFLCERTQATSKRCKFKTGRTILQRPTTTEEVAQLLQNRRTAFLAGFISSKTGRPFTAALVVDDGGKVGFEFPPRDEAG